MIHLPKLPDLKFSLYLLLLVGIPAFAQKPSELARWKKHAANVTIIRDDFGVPHIYGKTDADAVFGLLYAQCEDDFQRVEMNYLEKLGRVSEVKGEGSLYDDLLNQILIDTQATKKDYANSPAWLKLLMNAFADGINYYLYTHPATKPAVLKRFEPWFPLMWTDGSIGAISTADINMTEFRNFFSGKNELAAQTNWLCDTLQNGSNGFAFAPSVTASKNAILYINPHTSIYFRGEVHMVSEQGLNVYGAVTWGQFFVYQGFNERCGWMHTTSYNDAADSYTEKLQQTDGKWYYEYEGKQIPAALRKYTIWVKQGNEYRKKEFNTVFTGHGPVIAKRDGNFLSLKADNRIMNGLIQCWQRNKARNLTEYKKTMDLIGNISNNTVYADADGNIAFWHGNRIPIRDEKYDWSKPVDGTTIATEWKGYYPVKDIVQCINPKNGWLQNCNSTPFTVAGENSPKETSYPYSMAYHDENFRGIHAQRLLAEGKDYTLPKVIAAGYDTRMTAFEILIPALVNAFKTTITKTDYSYLNEAVNILQKWDYRCGENSVATTLAIHYGEMIVQNVSAVEIPGPHKASLVDRARKYAAEGNPFEMIALFAAVYESLVKKYGTWNIPWGQINRFQRISPDIDNKYDDAKPSLPIGFTSSAWGTLPSYISRTYNGSGNRYGSHGNSFICVVEFGKKIQARSLLAGGQSGDPSSSHFFDQGEMYTKGKFKDVYFYKEDVLNHKEKQYHP